MNICFVCAKQFSLSGYCIHGILGRDTTLWNWCGGSEFLWSLSVVAIERGPRKSLNEDESYNFPAIYIHNEFVLYCGTPTGVARGQEPPMKDAFEVLYQKEAELVRVRQEVESLRVVAELLSDAAFAEDSEAEPTAKRPVNSALMKLSETIATGTDGVPALPRQPRFWEFLKPARH